MMFSMLSASIAEATVSSSRRGGNGLIRGVVVGVGLVWAIWVVLVVAGVE